MPYRKPLRNSTAALSFWWQKVPIAQEQLDYFRDVESLKAPGRGAATPYIEDNPPVGVVWVRKADDSYEPWLPVPDAQGEAYDVYGAYLKSQKRRRPILSPHHHLREVGAGNVYRVLQFLRQHGGLTLDDLQEEPPTAAGTDSDRLRSNRYSSAYWFPLNPFRERQARFATAYSLWDGRVDADRLRKSWIALADQGVAGLEEVWQDQGRMFTAGLGRKGTQDRLTHSLEGLPDLKGWVPRASYEQLALLADAFVNSEINAATQDVKPVWLSRFDPVARRLVLNLTLQPGSLWGACWQLFGHDSISGKIARVCPHCAKLFYPKRKEQIFCTSRLQQLFAKRRWASINR